MYKSLERPVGGGLREWPCVAPESHLLDLGVSLALQQGHWFRWPVVPWFRELWERGIFSFVGTGFGIWELS